MSAVGSSVTAGQGAIHGAQRSEAANVDARMPPCLSPCLPRPDRRHPPGPEARAGHPYVQRWFDWVTSVSPDAPHVLRNPTFGGSTSAIYSVCTGLVQADVDLVSWRRHLSPAVACSPAGHLITALRMTCIRAPACLLLARPPFSPRCSGGGRVCLERHLPAWQLVVTAAAQLRAPAPQPSGLPKPVRGRRAAAGHLGWGGREGWSRLGGWRANPRPPA